MNYGWLFAPALLWHAGAALSAESPAPETARLWRELEPAWDVVADKIVKLVGEEWQRRMIDLAYAAVAANVCGGLALKGDDFQKAFAVFEDDPLRAMSEPDRKQREQHLLIHYGTCTGLLTAEALLTRDEFCAQAMSLSASGAGAAAYWGERPGPR
ncbi:MAG: hypothetical protein FJ189_03260 [Gammaproteobacteria bacterium]|nr:hypothetical protein [Gammaproteobacteria bacterium]